jgi:hypothetical protein
MFIIEERPNENIIVVTPKNSIKAENIESFKNQVNKYINTHDVIPNFVFRINSVPYWANFRALQEHFQFVKNHHKLVKKVAIISDSPTVTIMRSLVNFFTDASVRRFSEKAFDDAINWAQMEDDHPGSFLVIKDLPSDVIGLDARGLITAQDYRDTLVPLVKEKLQRHEKLKLLFVVGDYFDGYSEGALWDDVRFGFSYFATFSKLALVSDVQFIRTSLKIFGPLMPTEVMIFKMDEFEEAINWITI